MSENAQEPVPTQQAVEAQGPTEESTGRLRMMAGAGWLGFGVLVTLVSFATSESTGFHIIAFGPVIYGLVMVVAGAWAVGNET